jgi:TolA-binding protein
MNYAMKTIDNTIKYLNGELTGDEKLAYETELSTNKDAQKTKKLIEEIYAALKNEEHIKLIENLEMAKNTYKNEEESGRVENKPQRNLFLGKKFLLAAGVALLLAISSLVYIYNSGNTNDKIFASYYFKYESDVITRSINNTSEELIIAIQLYDRGNYNEAITKLDGILKKDYSNAPAHFFLGVSYIETKEYGKAIESLKNVIKLNDSAFNEHASWYLALCFIKTNQNGLATPILKQIALNNSFYKLNARDLLKSLE